MTATPLIQTKALTKQYPGILALDSVDFDLQSGEVHVLFGENGAGKSTLISMLAGANMPSKGSVVLDGQEVTFENVADAQAKGIYTVFQEFSLIPTLTVAQNIFLGWEPRNGLFIDHRMMRKRARDMLLELGFAIDPNKIVAQLSRAQQQMVEITKAFHGDLKVLILDEPTASLTDKEVDHLFDFVNALKAKGVGIVYISHRIQEFTRIADRVTVLRDGGKIGTIDMADTDEDALVEMMTGRAIDEIYPKIAHGSGEVVLSVKNLQTVGIHNASFDVRAGEVLGVAGLVGSGKSRLFRTVMGLALRLGGTVTMKGKDISHASTREIIRQGIYYLSPDRKAEGLDLAKSSKDNLAINLIMGDKVGGNSQFVKWSEVNSETATISNHVELHDGYRSKPVSQLSGGNQQKVLFGKCFGQNADLIIFDEPTVGVDMGTRAALYLLIKELAESGKAVVVISSDLPEVLHLSRRMIVLAHGHISAELSGDDMTEEQVLKYFFDESGAKQ
ncbi:sugar ABC transporter ATP-binding protein [Cohaesibacter gelatinilyticus]|uniref:Monosaccharide ABC transporter ATP-binding protein, CUT2 family n=1 Tax=Cohaesibacter gelatinilyticus TaxID=372072 RepID=A0A285PHQ3_9HYPH|nr:sugar ABC transporter ATP-binding protein [Cohaesibacter gelatinilyticus]SNZ21245.1 monosaccharide ABC transporter ATP-binding protein, CUT2 family [Cohaesibacter gelatinilyticus]